MRGNTIEDQMGSVQGESFEQDVNLEGAEQIELPQEPQPNKFSAIFDMLKTETGEGSVEEYIDKPLNFGKTDQQKKAIARMLRGLTGFLGSLDFAVIDIVMGFLDLQKGGGSHVGVGSRRESSV